MDENIIAKTRGAIQYFLAYEWGANRIKECFQEMIPKDGTEPFEFLATKKVLNELDSLLTEEDNGPPEPTNLAEISEPTQSEDSSIISATGGQWSNHPPLYTNALTLIQMIDPGRGAIGAEYTERLLGLFRQKFSKGHFFGLETIELLCQYSIMDSSQQKQLIESFLTGAERWLYDNHWTYTSKTLDFVRLLDANHHSEIFQHLEEIQDLITQRSWQPVRSETKDPSILEKLKQLKVLIEEQESLHFAPMKSNENSWRLEDARKQKRDTREPNRERRIRKQQIRERQMGKRKTQGSLYALQVAARACTGSPTG